MGYRNKIAVFSMLGLIGLDQITKYWAILFFQPPIKISEFFRLVFVENTGVAFSLPFPRIFLILFTVAVLFWALRYFFRYASKTRFQEIGGILFLSGAIGNLIDRVFRGAVVDFLSFWSFPIFNVADVCISIGVALILFDELIRKKTP